MGAVGVVDNLVSGLDALVDVDLDELSDAALDALLGDLQRLGHRMDAQLCRVADRWSQRGVWSSDGSRSAAARLSRDGHRSPQSAHRILARAQRLRSAPHVAHAFRVGDLSADHADSLLGASVGREALFERDEELLVAQARSLRFVPFGKVLDYWRRRADAELDDDGDGPSADPVLSLTSVGDLVAVDGQLDPIGGAIVIAAIKAIAEQLAQEDNARGCPARSRPESWAAALVEMARRAMAMPDGAQRARVLLQIVAGHDAFAELCELSNGHVIRAGQIVPHLEAVDVRSIVFDSATHAVATSSRRTFVGALRAVVQVRDRHCQHPSGCDEPIDRCDVDHITPWSHGGTTSQANGRLLCRFHNRIDPQCTRPPPTRDTGVDDPVGVFELDALLLWPTDDEGLVTYHLTYEELLQLGP